MGVSQIYVNLLRKGGDPESKRIFRLQKKVLRIIGGTGRRASCRNLFKTLNIIPWPSLYIRETVCGIKSNMEKMKCNREIHAKKQIFILNFAELHFLKTVVQIWV